MSIGVELAEGAIRHLYTADRIAPQRKSNDPIARDLVLNLDRRARRRVWELDSLRNRFGVGRREAEINPHVAPIAPRLLWQIDLEGWNILGFEHLNGRHANLAPGSADLSKLAAAEIWAQQIPSWATVSPSGIDAFTTANQRLWEQIAHDDPQPWKQRLHAAAQAWAKHRTTVVTTA